MYGFHAVHVLESDLALDGRRDAHRPADVHTEHDDAGVVRTVGTRTNTCPHKTSSIAVRRLERQHKQTSTRAAAHVTARFRTGGGEGLSGDDEGRT